MVFGVPLKESYFALSFGVQLYIWASTGIGLLVSSFMRSQIAAIFGAAILTILPAVSFSGMVNLVSSLSGIGRLIGEIFPTIYFLIIARGTFSKGLGLSDLHGGFIPLAVAVPVLLLACLLLLKKQEG